jgi:ribonucleotide reductase alpha subunit
VVSTEVAETIQYAATVASQDLAARDGAYSSYKGSPHSRGLFQHDLAVRTGTEEARAAAGRPCGRWDWESRRGKPMRHSLLTGYMPSAGTGQLLDLTACIEPPTSFEELRRTKAGDFLVHHRPLYERLARLGLDTPMIRSQIRANKGSIQGIEAIPEWVRAIHRTVWEIPVRSIQEMAAARGAFVDQSQSLNLWVPTHDNVLFAAALYQSWSLGLKNGVYYPTSPPATQAMAVTSVARSASGPARLEGSAGPGLAPSAYPPTPLTSAQPATEEPEPTPSLPLVCRRDNPECLECAL